MICLMAFSGSEDVPFQNSSIEQSGVVDLNDHHLEDLDENLQSMQTENDLDSY